jgi:uncharacterized protein
MNTLWKALRALSLTGIAVGLAMSQSGSAGRVPKDVNSPDDAYPAVNGYGRIVPLHNALQQPRDNSRIVVDITRGGEPDKLNSAIEKVARFVNIYRGAGRQPATVDIKMVLHGDATLAILKPTLYSKRFNTKGNPNLDCLSKLHKQGVEVLVCGQSLIGKEANPEDVIGYCGVAVSALTSIVNLQADGYSFVPLGK